MIKPYSYQQKIIDADPSTAMLSLGCGTGKTFLALSLAHGATLVITTKTIRDDHVFERQLEKMDKQLSLKVVSKEEFKKIHATLPAFETVIIDEHHTVCGLTPNVRYRKKEAIPKASQIFEACQEFLKRTTPKRLYLLSATPIRNPMTVLAAGWLLGKKWDFYKWRYTFYVKLPMPGYNEVWAPKKDSATKDKLAQIVRSLGPTGRLSDFADVPEQTHIVKHIPLSGAQISAIKELPMVYPDPIVLIGKKHQVEQGILTGNEFENSQIFETEKIDAILQLCEEYEKVLIFAKYTAQIHLIAQAIKVPVFILNGQTKDRGALIREAEASERCVVICQSQISAGYELPSFRCTIFASESWSVVDHFQSIGRTLRMNKLAPNLYVYLISGTIDAAVRTAIESKRDFSEKIYINNE